MRLPHWIETLRKSSTVVEAIEIYQKPSFKRGENIVFLPPYQPNEYFLV